MKISIIVVVCTVGVLDLSIRYSFYGDCDDFKKTALTSVDWLGFVKPFGAINFWSEKDTYTILFVDNTKSKKLHIRNRLYFSILQQVSYACQRTDSGTPDKWMVLMNQDNEIISFGIDNFGLDTRNYGAANPASFVDLFLHYLFIVWLPKYVAA